MGCLSSGGLHINWAVLPSYNPRNPECSAQSEIGAWSELQTIPENFTEKLLRNDHCKRCHLARASGNIFAIANIRNQSFSGKPPVSSCLLPGCGLNLLKRDSHLISRPGQSF